jgi:hypothetical protein
MGNNKDNICIMTSGSKYLNEDCVFGFLYSFFLGDTEAPGRGSGGVRSAVRTFGVTRVHHRFLYGFQDVHIIPDWERMTSFDPVKAVLEIRTPTWVNCSGEPLYSTSPRSIISEDWKSLGSDWGSLIHQLPLRDYKHFVAGQLHEEWENWQLLLQQVDNDSSKLVGNWIENKVDIFDFFPTLQRCLWTFVGRQ